jgi:hypothetical protein
MREKVLYLVVLLATFGSCMGYCSCPSLSQISEEYLRCVFTNDFGHTLVGAKPASVDDSHSEYLQETFPQEVEAARTFLKATFLHSKRFVLRKVRGSLWLIDKTALLNQVSKYSSFKSFVINKFKSEDRFIEFLQNSEHNLFEALEYNFALAGIALGYGEENSKFFTRRCELGEYLQKYPFVSLYPFDSLPMILKVRGLNFFFYPELTKLESPNLSQDFRSLEEEWLWMKEVDWPLYLEVEPEPPYYICLPTYISRRGEESERIHARYLKARDEIAELFYGRKISEVLVEKATEE